MRGPGISRFWHLAWVQYAIGLGSVALATAARIPFEAVLVERAPFALYYPAIVLTAWYCGLGPAALATGLSLVAAWYFFVPYPRSFALRDPADVASLVLYLLVASTLVWVARRGAASGRSTEDKLDEARRSRRTDEARAHLSAIVESSDDAIVSKDLHGMIRSWNDGAARIFGYSADEVVGRPITILLPPDRQNEEAEILERLRRGERVDHFETVRLAKDGRPIDISLTVSPVRADSGTIVGASKIARDITARKRAAAALRDQREWFRVTLSSIGDAVITSDAAGRVTFMNRVAEALTGWRVDDALGESLAEVFHIINEETRARIMNPAEKVIRDGQVLGLANHTVLVARDGIERPISDSAAPIRDDRSNILGVVLVFHDVTERRRAEQALVEQREWLETTLESIGDAVIATDVHGRIVFMNPVAERLTGWTASDALARECAEVFRIVNEQTRQLAAAPVARVLREGLVVGLANHTVLIAADGTEKPIDDSGAPIRGRDAAVIGAVLVFRDVTDRRRGDRERAQAAEERERILASERAARSDAERANHLKDQFVATVSHELRTPLTAILGWTHLLKRPNADSEQLRHGFEVIERNTRIQMQLISDLLDISRIATGKLRLEIQDVDLADLVRACVLAALPGAAAKRVAIAQKLEETGTIPGDAARLQQVVTNLLSNAIKFTAEGGRVTVTLERRESRVEIAVEDNGIGIHPDFLPILFERFRQGDPSTTRRFGGLGLGLAIVKQLVVLHGGTVRAESEGEGRGARFVVTLSLERPAAEPQAAPVRSAAGAGEPSLRGIKILVVEDERDTREVVRRLLEDQGAEVFTAASAAEALKLVSSRQPQILVSDIGLPEVDGYEVIRQIRQRNPKIPAIALTAFARPEDRSRAIRAGYQAYLVKPVEATELLAVIGSFTESLPRPTSPPSEGGS